MVLAYVASCPLAVSSQHVHPLKCSYLDLFQLCDISLDWEGDIQLVPSSLKMALLLAKTKVTEYFLLKLPNLCG